MLIVLAEAKIGEGALDEARAAIATMVEASLVEPGCISYAFAQDALDPTKLHIVEKWVDDAALTFHFGTPHMAVFQKALSAIDLTVTSGLKYQADDGAALM